MKAKTRRILGIDPGYGRMGWAVIDVTGQNTVRVESGHFSTPAGLTDPVRLVQLFDELSAVIKKHHPTEAAMERLFFQKNVTTAIGVGQARGVALVIMGQYDLAVREFTPSDIKLATTGYGRADKRQMGQMITVLLKLPAIPKNDDEADALAIALCAAAHRPIYAA